MTTVRCLLILVLSLAPVMALAPESPVGAGFREIHLGVLPGDVVGTLAHDKRGSHVATVVGRKGGSSVWVDGRLGRKYAAIYPGSLTFSPDGQRVAWVATNSPPERRDWFVVLGGEPTGPRGLIFGHSLLFSPDGRHYAYGAGVRGKWRVIVDGRVRFRARVPPLLSPEMRERGASDTFVFSPDGSRLAWIEPRGQKVRVVVNRRPGPAHDGVRLDRIHFSPDSRRMAYIARAGVRYRVVVDGRLGLTYSAVDPGSLQFSSDSKHFAYAAAEGRRSVVVVDGRPIGEHEGVMEGSLVLSPTGSRVAYAALKNGKWAAILDGIQGPEYDGIGRGSLVFSPDGKRFAYAGMKGTRWNVVLDGRASSEYDGVAQVVFGPNSASYAYSASKTGKWQVVWNGRPGPADFTGIGDLQFSCDSQHVAYPAGLGSKLVVVLDQARTSEYGQIIPGGPSFHADGSLEFLGVRNGQLYRVTASPQLPIGHCPILHEATTTIHDTSRMLWPHGQHTSTIRNGPASEDSAPGSHRFYIAARS